jgi:transposase
MSTTIKAMLPSEIAALYGVSVRTLNNWLRPFRIGDVLKRKKSKYYTVKQVAYIFECLGAP